MGKDKKKKMTRKEIEERNECIDKVMKHQRQKGYDKKKAGRICTAQVLEEDNKKGSGQKNRMKKKKKKGKKN